MAPSLQDVLRLPVTIPAQISRDLSTVAEAVGRLPALIAALDTRLGHLALDVAALRDTASTLASDLRGVGQTVERADARVGQLEVLVGELAGRVTHIDDGLDDRVGHLERLVEQLAATVGHIDEGLDARIPNLQPVPGDVRRITRDVARVLELTPDPDEEQGALEKVREALTPGD